MSDQLVGEEEELVRAVCSPDGYDRDAGRISSLLMTGKNTSVSRTKLIPLQDHWELFRRCVEKPDVRKLELCATITIPELRAIAEQHAKDYNIPKREIKVVVKPNSCWKPPDGHAEIEGRLSQGLANTIIKKLHYLKEDGSLWTFDGVRLVAQEDAA